MLNTTTNVSLVADHRVTVCNITIIQPKCHYGTCALGQLIRL